MQLSDIPFYSALKFAVNAATANVRSIPQTTTDPAAASFNLGFPPQTFTDEGAGGTPMDGRDQNGILQFLDAWRLWQSVGGGVVFISGVSYPKGAKLVSTVNPAIQWVSTVDNNTVNPDSGPSANWTMTGDIAHNLGASPGYFTLPVGPGLIINYGTVSLSGSSGYATVTFAKPFPSASLPFAGATNITNANPSSWPGIGNITKTTATVGMSIAPAGGGSGVPAPAGTAALWWVAGY